MNVIKPLTLGCLHRPYSIADRHYLSIAALGFFTLGEQCSRFLLETLQWKQVMKKIPAGQPLDPAMPKGRGEYLVAGEARPCGKRPVNKMQVEVSVGRLAKRLTVYGDRTWYYGALGALHISKPAVIDSVPLDYGNAYGGAAFAANRQGKGYYGNRMAWLAGRTRGEMPNVEYEGASVTNHYGNFTPAALGPKRIQDSFDPEKAGTYDKKWLKDVFPGFASDLDFSLFNQAARDQQINGYWQGGEKYMLKGMHDDYPEISGNLPRFAVKAMVSLAQEDETAHEILALQPETIWFVPEYALGLVIYRGNQEIRDSDAMDVNALLLAYENPGEDKGKEHYIRTLARRLDRKNYPAEMLNEAALIPRQPAPTGQEEKKSPDTGRQDARTQALTDHLKARVQAPEPAPGSPASPPPKVQDVSTALPVAVPKALTRKLSLDEIASGGIDLGGDLKKLEKEVAAYQKTQEEALAKATKKAEAAKATGVKSETGYDYPAALKNARFLPIDLYPDTGQWTPDQENLLNMLSANPDKEKYEDTRAHLLKMNALQRQAKARQTSMPDEYKALDGKDGEKLGLFLHELVHASAPIAGREFRDVRIKHANLTGVNLDEADFQGARFSNCRFDNCSLKDTNFLGAYFDRCSFKAAALNGTNFSQATLASCRFDHAGFDASLFVGSKLEGCSLVDARIAQGMFKDAAFAHGDFSGASLVKTVFQQVDLCGSRWASCTIGKGVFLGCRLDKADFTGADIGRTVFVSVSAPLSCWSDVTAERCYFGNSTSLAGAVWTKARFRTCGFGGTGMAQADMAGAVFYQCDFSKADLKGANLEAGVLCRSLFVAADLAGSNCRNADLYQAVCRKSNFTRADLRHCNMVEADKVGIVLDRARLEGLVERAS